jgi:hypothetical protein
MELACWLFLLSNGDIEVIECLIEIVKLVIEQSSEEVKAGLLFILTAAIDGHVEELLGLQDLLLFLQTVHVHS